MQEQMTLEEYKKKVEECLKKAVGADNQDYITSRMKLYEEDFPTFLEKNLSPEVTATALIMGA